jgi:hypothetical protein
MKVGIPHRLVMLLGICASLLAGCFAHPPPPIAKDLPSGFRVGATFFNERVAQRFPVGSDEKALRAELTRERFSFTEDPSHQYSFSARFETENIPCRNTWRIRWSADQGKIGSIEGYYGSICL